MGSICDCLKKKEEEKANKYNDFNNSYEGRNIIDAKNKRDNLQLIKNLEAQLQHAGECYEEAEKELKKQEAVKPKIDAFGHPYCPKCKILVYETWEFCPHCGQEMKWDV